MWPCYMILRTCAHSSFWRHFQFCLIRVVFGKWCPLPVKEYSSHYIITENTFPLARRVLQMLFNQKLEMSWLRNAVSRRCTCGEEKTWSPYLNNVLCLPMIADKNWNTKLKLELIHFPGGEFIEEDYLQ